MAWAIVLLAAGLALLWKGADLLVHGAVAIATRLGVSQLVVGLTVVAMGTSAPEVAASIAAVLGKRGDIAIGNVYGSNIANLALVGGLVALISPLRVQATTLRREIPAMLAVALLLWPLLHNLQMGRAEGLLLLGIFVAMVVFTVRTAHGEAQRNLAARTPDERPPAGKLSKNLALVVAGLAGLTLGLVGFGRIGRAVARIGLAFGMQVIAYDPAAQDDVPAGCTMVELDEVFRQSDVVSLHCPLTTENTGLVNADRLRLMKATSFLINTSRGPLIDEQALADALRAERIAGAGLDVLAVEPPETDNPLLTAKNCHVTPHIAWATQAARQRLLDVTVQNVAAFLQGRPQNVINAPLAE